MWISGTSQYAIRAVVHVARNGALTPVRVGPIAEALDVPRNYLSKTLHVLAREGVLRSVRGRNGGFQLAHPPARLTLARVTAPFDDLATRHCLLGNRECAASDPCAAHGRWGAVSSSLQEFFKRTTIADLIGDTEDLEVADAARPRAGVRRAPRKKA